MNASAEEKIQSQADLQSIREELAESGQKVVQCHGCFDIVHPGHIRYLEFAKQQGDRLIVSVTSDENVDKGVKRPFIPEKLRAENLAALEIVDYVVIDDHDWAGPILEKLRPDFYVKGKEYETKPDPRFEKEKQIVEGYGGDVVYSSGDVVYSSSYIIDEFKERFNLQNEKIEAFRRRHDIDHDILLERLNRLRDKSVVVVGDPILDRYIHSEQQGSSSEGPIPSVSPMEEEWYLGAAGLIARQLKALGTDVTFVVPLGDDELAQRCRDTIRDDDIELVELDVEERPTYQKARYIVENKKILKVNHGRYSPISAQVTERMLDTLEDVATGKDGLIAADFGYGLFGPELVSGLNQIVHSQELSYYIDVSSGGASNLLSFESPTAAFPSEEELRFAFGDQESGLSHLAVNYFDATDAKQLVLTLGKQGVIIFYPPAGESSERASPTEYLPALTSHSLDPVGAGDIFLSSYVGFDLLEREPAHSVYLGAVLAALHVNHMGNAPVRAENLQRVLSGKMQVR